MARSRYGVFENKYDYIAWLRMLLATGRWRHLQDTPPVATTDPTQDRRKLWVERALAVLEAGEPES